MVPCVISLIATEVMLSSMGYLWCVASTSYIQTIIGTTKVYTCSHKDLSGLLHI